MTSQRNFQISKQYYSKTTIKNMGNEKYRDGYNVRSHPNTLQEMEKPVERIFIFIFEKSS